MRMNQRFLNANMLEMNLRSPCTNDPLHEHAIISPYLHALARTMQMRPATKKKIYAGSR